jgi:peptide/nickel transport system permease protein
VTNGLIVESLFGLPGLGTTLNQALRANDYMVIYGIVLFITVAVACLMAIVDLTYPLLDPRVKRH